MTEVLDGGREAKKIDDNKHTTGKTDTKNRTTQLLHISSSINNKVFLIEFLIQFFF